MCSLASGVRTIAPVPFLSPTIVTDYLRSAPKSSPWPRFLNGADFLDFHVANDEPVLQYREPHIHAKRAMLIPMAPYNFPNVGHLAQMATSSTGMLST